MTTEPLPTYAELRARRRSFRESAEDDRLQLDDERRDLERWVLGWR